MKIREAPCVRRIDALDQDSGDPLRQRGACGDSPATATLSALAVPIGELRKRSPLRSAAKFRLVKEKESRHSVTHTYIRRHRHIQAQHRSLLSHFSSQACSRVVEVMPPFGGVAYRLHVPVPILQGKPVPSHERDSTAC